MRGPHLVEVRSSKIRYTRGVYESKKGVKIRVIRGILWLYRFDVLKKSSFFLVSAVKGEFPLFFKKSAKNEAEEAYARTNNRTMIIMENLRRKLKKKLVFYPSSIIHRFNRGTKKASQHQSAHSLIGFAIADAVHNKKKNIYTFGFYIKSRPLD